MRPPRNFEIPFDMLFPLLVYYFAQLEDKELGGEYGADLNWDKILNMIDIQRKISVSYAQLDSLVYSYKMGVMDQRKPMAHVLKYFAANYWPLMTKFKQLYPDLFIEEKDGEISLVGKDPTLALEALQK